MLYVFRIIENKVLANSYSISLNNICNKFLIKILSLFFSLLPEPTQVTYDQLERVQPVSKAVISTRFEPPPYGHRKGFIPRAERDFGDGGAFPEIPVVQFPLVRF